MIKAPAIDRNPGNWTPTQLARSIYRHVIRRPTADTLNAAQIHPMDIWQLPHMAGVHPPEKLASAVADGELHPWLDGLVLSKTGHVLWAVEDLSFVKGFIIRAIIEVYDYRDARFDKYGVIISPKLIDDYVHGFGFGTSLAKAYKSLLDHAITLQATAIRKMA